MRSVRSVRSVGSVEVVREDRCSSRSNLGLNLENAHAKSRDFFDFRNNQFDKHFN